MDTETPSKSKKFLKIILGVFVALLVIAGTAFILTKQKNAQQPEAKVSVPTRRTYTAEEKAQILASITREVFKDKTPQPEKERILRNLAKQVPTVNEPSVEEKTRILQALVARTEQ